MRIRSIHLRWGTAALCTALLMTGGYWWWHRGQYVERAQNVPEMFARSDYVGPLWWHKWFDRHAKYLESRRDWLISPFERIRGVGFSSSAAPDLTPLVGNPDLEIISFEGCFLSNTNLSPLQSLPQLRSLDLSDSSVTDDQLQALAGCLQLEQLNLAGTRISHRGFAALKNCLRLSVLSLRDTAVDDAALAEVANLSGLKSLSCKAKEGELSDRGLESLTSLSNLKCLILSGKGITDRGMKSLAQLPALEDLTLSTTSVTGDGLKELARSSSLKILTFSSTGGIKEQDLLGLSHIHNLDELHVSVERISPAWQQTLQGLASLKHLAISFRFSILDADGVKNLASSSSLEGLSLLHPTITDQGAAEFARFASLKHLRVATFMRLPDEQWALIKKPLLHLTEQPPRYPRRHSDRDRELGESTAKVKNPFSTRDEFRFKSYMDP